MQSKLLQARLVDSGMQNVAIYVCYYTRRLDKFINVAIAHMYFDQVIHPHFFVYENIDENYEMQDHKI